MKAAIEPNHVSSLGPGELGGHTSRAIRDEYAVKMMRDLMDGIVVRESSDRGASRDKATKDVLFLYHARRQRALLSLLEGFARHVSRVGNGGCYTTPQSITAT